MDIDLDLYRHEVRVSTSPLAHGAVSATSLVRLSAIDISTLTSIGCLVSPTG
jgi:hypothetical protein